MKFLKLSLASLFLLISCASTQNAQKSAECAAIRTFYDKAQTQLIDRGACDEAATVEECLPHIALREAFIVSLKENKCGSEEAQ
jgi:hypothetical protein